jgi:APA family basic amino acid/polyamine antiporter
MSATLQRRLGLRDAVVIGLGSMLGAGVFVVWAPAAARAGSGPKLLIALLLASLVAAANATSSARLAARYPESGGAYVYGYERLGPWAGRLAGWAFVIGKSASCAAMALAIGAYAWPAEQRIVALVAVAVLTAINLRGIAKTALATRILVVVTMLILAAVLVAGISAPAAAASAGSARGDVLGAAGLIFFAFAGYARIATLGEEVLSPERTIPRAITIALGIVLVIYVSIALVTLHVLGIDGLRSATAPLAEVVSAAGLPGLVPVVRAGATIAVVGVLLALIAGVGRTVLAMARRGDAPRPLAEVRHGVPARAEIVVACVVLVLVAIGGLGSAIAISSCAVLIYYAVANAAAWTLSARWPGRAVAAFGLLACLTLAATVLLP